jgi:glycosyltransferase involved in cell wall biosynthesis
MMVPGLWLRVVEVGAWLVALAWVLKVLEAALGLPNVANLLMDQYDRSTEGLPSLTVIVPARNEAKDIRSCLESLLAQEYPGLRIVAVNDRSIDETGSVMEAVAEASSGRLQVKHVVALPDRWLGKTHAMAMAAGETDSEWLLFTDADVLFRADSLRRSMAYAVESGADHLVTVPTTILKRWDEGSMLGFFQIFGLWAARPWKVADPKAQRDAIGIGAFNLIRRSAYERIGGFEALRMEIIEDIGLGRRVKRAGLRQRVAFGRGLVRVHWAAGATGLVGVLTKNLFSAFRFYVSLALLACIWLLVFSVAPVFGLLISGTRIPAVITLAAIGVAYRLYGRTSGISAWQALLSPFAAMMFVYSLLWSMVTTLRQGGVMWRGTFYSLAELRRHAAPLRAPRAQRTR